MELAVNRLPVFGILSAMVAPVEYKTPKDTPAGCPLARYSVLLFDYLVQSLVVKNVDSTVAVDVGHGLERLGV